MSQGSALVSVSPLTTLTSRAIRGRRAFRLEYADGRVLKGRSFKDSSEAAQFVELTRGLDEAWFPRTIACADAAVLTAWIHGRPLAPSDCTPARVESCGRLLGQLHAIPLGSSQRQCASAAAVPDLSTLRQDADELVFHGILARAQAAAAVAIAADQEPARRDVGLVHDDFCAENMIIDGDGRVWIVDNEGLDLGAFDFDLARTWYRWPLPPALREAFYRGYAEHRPVASFRAHFWFWAVSVLIGSAVFRLRTHDDGVAVPCRRLDSLLQTSRTAEALTL